MYFLNSISTLLILLFSVITIISANIIVNRNNINNDADADVTVFNGEGCDDDKLFKEKFQPKIKNEIAADVRKIVEYITKNEKQIHKTYDDLSVFVDKFGSRLTSTENLEKAIDYMIEWLKKEGHDNVRGENVKVPKWTRGREWARMIKPRNKTLNILGLGLSDGTNGQVIEAPIIVVNSFNDLKAKADLVPGKVVVFNYVFHSYGEQNNYRTEGPSEAAKYGAIAAMVRSLAPFSINSPHTGAQDYAPNVTRIPAISITTEDADLFQRLVDRKEEVIVQFYSENTNYKEGAVSRNTISEIEGSENPEQIVLVSGHLDSWDVGQGAMDDGAGAFVSWRALSILKQLGLKPKRTIRSILWTGEEFGLYGADSYAKEHESELDNHVLAMESDIGTFNPIGLTYSGKNRTSQCTLWEIMQLMNPINATRLTLKPDGSDVFKLYDKGVPITSLDNDNYKYFYFHHTEGDTMTVENPDELDKCQALWTSVAYALAALDYPLPR